MNQRKERRIEERNTVVIRSAGSANGPQTNLGVNAYTYDLSLGGARLFTDRPFAVGTTIRIVIELAKTCQMIQVDGEVKWMRESGSDGVFEIGVEFLHNISQTILSLIRHLYGMANGVSASVTACDEISKELAEPEVKAPVEPTLPLTASPQPSVGAGPEAAPGRARKRKGVRGGAAAGEAGPGPRN
ncbi:MAG TPA: PilZ domain-containing protein [Terriglobales bacterium]|nr:PilZ domain-containing protein [Terriglobales bacterium]